MDIPTIISAVKTNISLLQRQVDSIDPDSTFGQKLRQFYSNKIAIQEANLEWLSKYDAQLITRA